MNGGDIGEFIKDIEQTAKYMGIDLNYFTKKIEENYSWSDMDLLLKILNET
ncbi:MAG: hypothetical protein AB6733_08135 [Clostridiaceae bacterium]